MKLNNGIDGDGFAIVPTRFSSEQIASVAKALRNSPLPRTRAGIRHAMRDSVVVELANSAELLQIARATLGGHAIPFRATLFDKSPAANWLVVWHQDTALPIRERRDQIGWGPWSVKDSVIYAHAPACALEQIVALRVHLDDSCSENGPLRVLPGTHNAGVLSDDEIHRLAYEISPVDCFAPKGGVLAMRPLIVHSSSKSKNQNPRRVLHIEYARSMDLRDGLELCVA